MNTHFIDKKEESEKYENNNLICENDSSSFENNNLSCEINSSSCEIEEESNDEDYFGDNNLFISSSSDKEAWEDSESEEQVLRSNYKNDANWINTKEFKKSYKINTKNIKLDFLQGIFKSNYNIRHIKYKNNILCLVDTKNIIYLLEDFKLIYSTKIDKFNISDIEFFNNKIYICNNKFNKLKVIDYNYNNYNNKYRENKHIENDYNFNSDNNKYNDNKHKENKHKENDYFNYSDNKYKENNYNIKNIEKVYTKNIRILRSYNNYLYLLGDTTLLLNEDLEILEEIYNKSEDITYFNNSIYLLNSSGDILQYTKDLKLINKIIYEDKFTFKKLIGLTNYLVINTTRGLIFIDKDYKYIKETKENNNLVINVTEHEDLFIYFTDNKKGLKILNNKFRYINKKNNIGTCREFINTEKGIIMCRFREVNILRIN